MSQVHIHAGLKDKNPVDRMRFFNKHNRPDKAAQHVSSDYYRATKPEFFEDLQIRVFCRDKAKAALATKSFASFCKIVNTSAPYLSLSQEEDEGPYYNDGYYY